MRQISRNTGDDGVASPDRRLLTIKEAAELLGCSTANVYALRATGQLSFVPIGRRKGYRIPPAEIDAFIERRREHPVAAPPKMPRPRLKHIRLS